MSPEQMGTGGTLPTPGKDATLEELNAAYRSIEASDAPEFLKDRVRMDLSDRIREYGRPKKDLEPMGHGRSFTGASAENVADSGYKGRLLDADGRMVKAKP